MLEHSLTPSPPRGGAQSLPLPGLGTVGGEEERRGLACPVCHVVGLYVGRGLGQLAAPSVPQFPQLHRDAGRLQL